MRPLGLLGGTFDPVHFGHLRLAEEAHEALGLAEVRWIPTGQPPHRQEPCVDTAHRLEMTRRAVADNPAFTVDDAETRSAAVSYTVTTLGRLRAEAGDRSLVILMGADAFLGLTTWHRWRELFSLAHIGVATRAGFDLSAAALPAELAEACAGRLDSGPGALRAGPSGRVVPFAMTSLAISASLVRERLAAGLSVRYLLPDPVREYIQQHHLYRMTDGR